MSLAVVTGWSGDPFREIHELTSPLIREFAETNGAEFISVSLDGDRPASWQKITHLTRLLTERESVLWIDADIVIKPDAKFPFAKESECEAQAMVTHHTPSGTVPNCGLWLVHQAMAETLRLVWDSGNHIDHVWWEQAAILEAMGFEPNPNGCWLEDPQPLYHATRFLDKKWNWHIHDAFAAEIPEAIHCTQAANRVDWIAAECASIREQ